jgi:hypothetical protein
MPEEKEQTSVEETETQEPETPQENSEETDTPETPTEDRENSEPESEETQEEEESEPPQPPEKPQVEPEEPPYKQKFRESARENQIAQERLRQKDARITQLTTIETPTEEELRRAYPFWDELEEIAKDAYRRLYLTENRTRKLENTVLDLIEEKEWERDFARLVSSNPKLKGREEEFKRYAYKPSHKTVPLNTLVKAFFYEFPEPQAHSPKPKPGLERGSGGPKSLPKPKKIPLEEAKKIRETDYRKYLELVKSGQIEEDIE